MSNIEKAIAKEKEYLSYRMRGEQPFHLVDAIKECGFATLTNYFNAKIEYNFNKLSFAKIEKSPSECIDYFFHMMNTKQTGIVFIDSNETFVFSGESKKYDADYCQQNNIPIYPLYTRGGAIVSAKGDFSIGLCFPETIGADTHFVLEKIKNIFSKYMENVQVRENDILLDGNKICGSIMYHKNGMKCFAAHFSFDNHTELIERICGISGSVKTPTTVIGLTVDGFKKELCEWLRLQ